MLKPLAAIDAAGAASGYTMKKPLALEPWLYLAALALFAADVLAVLMLSTGLRLGRRAATTSAVILLALMLLPQMPLASEAEPPAHKSTGNAADDFALKASLQTRLAYVITGDADIDHTSEEGLSGLSKVLRARTALEPGEPIGVDIDKDELAFFPVLYWPVREDVQPLSDATLAKVDAFMKQGGLIIFDTRDQGVSAVDTARRTRR